MSFRIFHKLSPHSTMILHTKVERVQCFICGLRQQLRVEIQSIVSLGHYFLDIVDHSNTIKKLYREAQYHKETRARHEGSCRRSHSKEINSYNRTRSGFIKVSQVSLIMPHERVQRVISIVRVRLQLESRVPRQYFNVVAFLLGTDDLPIILKVENLIIGPNIFQFISGLLHLCQAHQQHLLLRIKVSVRTITMNNRVFEGRGSLGRYVIWQDSLQEKIWKTLFLCISSQVGD